MKHRRIIPSLLALSAVSAAILIWHPWPPRFGDHFGFSLPPTATLLHSHQDFSLEPGYEFEFAVTDDTLRNAIIKDWNLRPPGSDNDVWDFAPQHGEPWWSRMQLGRLPEQYGRNNKRTSEYWSLWVDRKNGRVYAEHGRW